MTASFRTEPGGLLGHAAGVTKRDKRFAGDLMHQQCWCWGRDVGGEENLLLRYGFTRRRRPGVHQTGAGGTRYEYEGTDGTGVVLWGFGMSLRLPSGEHGFFARYRHGVWLLPRSYDLHQVHSDRAIEPHLRRPEHSGDRAAARRIATAATDWCAAYEQWIHESVGSEHRRLSLTKWKQAVVEADDMVAAWKRARNVFKRWYSESNGRVVFEATDRFEVSKWIGSSA